MNTSKDTRTDLVMELEALLPGCGAMKAVRVNAIIARARRGDFHCFKSPYDVPKVELVNALRTASLNALARRVIAGEFDETPDAADAAAMALELKDEPELRRMLKLPDPVKA